MYNKIEKYIYQIGSDNYRIKIQKKDKATGTELKVSQNYKLPLEEVIRIRDDILKEFENQIKLKTIDYESNSQVNNLSKGSKSHKKKQNNKEKLVEKYIYQLDKDKYRVKIKKGTPGEIGYFNFSRIVYGKISVARKLRDEKLALHKLNKTVPSDRNNITVEEFSKIFLENHCKPLSPTTYDGIVDKLNVHILPELGRYRLGKLDTFLLQRFINKVLISKKKTKGKEKETISTTTANDVYKVLRNMLNRAVDWEFLKENPILKVTAPPIAKVEKETFNKEELIDVFIKLKYENIESQCMFMITMFTGIRKGELLGLHLDDIDFEEGNICIRRDVIRDRTNHKVIEKDRPKTDGSIREIPVPAFCLDIIREYLEYRERKIEGLKIKNSSYKEIDNLFISSTGDLMRPEYPGKKWNSFLKKNNFKHVTLHGLRHSYCTLQMNENTELGPNDVAELMGHSQLSTTFHYSHKNTDKKEQAISIFNDFEEGKAFNINQVLSICTGKKYTSTKEISDILIYLLPNEEIEIANKMEYCKTEILRRYPRLKSVNDKDVTIDNIFDWLEIQQQKYGNQFYLKPLKTAELPEEIDINFSL